jgi:hypothetical protein
MAYISPFGNHVIDNSYNPVMPNLDLMARAAKTLNTQYQQNYMLMETLKDNVSSLTFANEDLQNDYNTKTNKIEEYYKGNPQIDYTNPDSIKQLMNLYNPLMKDNELIANYKYDKSVRTEAQKVNELRRTNDKSYNAVNDTVFQNAYSEYTKANKKDVANKANQAKYTPFFDVNTLHKECDKLKGRASKVGMYNAAGEKITQESAGPNAETYENCIKGVYRSPEAMMQFDINAQYGIIANKNNPKFQEDSVTEYNNYVEEDRNKINNIISSLEGEVALIAANGGDASEKLNRIQDYKTSLNGLKNITLKDLENNEVFKDVLRNNEINYRAKSYGRAHASDVTNYDVDRKEITQKEVANIKANKGKSGEEGSGMTFEAPLDIAIAGTQTVKAFEDELKKTEEDLIRTIDNKVATEHITPKQQEILLQQIKGGQIDFQNKETIEVLSKDRDFAKQISKYNDSRNMKNRLTQKANENFNNDMLKTFEVMEKARPDLKALLDKSGVYTTDSNGKKTINSSKLDAFLNSLSVEEVKAFKKIKEAPSTYTGQFSKILQMISQYNPSPGVFNLNLLKTIKDSFFPNLPDITDLPNLATFAGQKFTNASFLKENVELLNTVDPVKRKAYIEKIQKNYDFFNKKGEKLSPQESLRFITGDYSNLSLAEKADLSTNTKVSLKSSIKEKEKAELAEKYKILGAKTLSDAQNEIIMGPNTRIKNTKVIGLTKGAKNYDYEVEVNRLIQQTPGLRANIGSINNSNINTINYYPEAGYAVVELTSNLLTSNAKELKNEVEFWSYNQKDWVKSTLEEALKEGKNKITVKTGESTVKTPLIESYFSQPGIQTLGTLKQLHKNHIMPDIKNPGKFVNKGVIVEERADKSSYLVTIYTNGVKGSKYSLSFEQLQNLEMDPDTFYGTLENLPKQL